MATTSKYFVITPDADNLDFLDFSLNYGSVTTVGESIQYNGSAKVDSVFVRPGMTYDLTNTAAGTDKIYFTGNLADYTHVVSGNVLTLSRTVGGLSEVVTLSNGTPLVFDKLVFADGTVSSSALATAVAVNTTLPTPNSVETSLAPTGAAAPGATLNATVQAFSTSTAAAGQVGTTFASTRPGINLIVNGGAGIDTVYVANGETVDARVLGGSVDLVYMRGTWAEYTKTLLSNDTELLLTRVINGVTESVKVTTGTTLNHDKLIFADGAVTTNNAKAAVLLNSTGPITAVNGVELNTKTPLYNNAEVAAALTTIRDAAQANSATPTTPEELVYAVAGVTGVTAANLSSISSALNSAAVNGIAADTTAEVQAIVNAYQSILNSADGSATPNTTTALTGAQYTAIGVTGVSGISAEGNALHLLDDVVDGKPTTSVDTVPEVQALADAAAHVLAAAGGTPNEIAALTLVDFQALGITGVTVDNLPAVLAAIAAATDLGVDTKAELQAIVTLAQSKAATALNAISAAAQANNATATSPAATVYAEAGVTGVTAANLSSISSALNSAAVNGIAADTTAEVQAIVNAYQSILNSADGTAANTTVPLTGAQYTAIGVTGVSGISAEGNSLHLLDDVVDAAAFTAVDLEAEVQAMANAANAVIAAAGKGLGTSVSKGDLEALGILHITDANLAAVQAAIGVATTLPAGVDTQVELQALADRAIAAMGSALTKLQNAANANSAGSIPLTVLDYAQAGLAGVTDANVGAMNSALDSAPVTSTQLGTEDLAQGVVDSYLAILAAANGSAGSTPVTAAQYTAIGVTGVTGTPIDGSALKLLDDAVDRAATTAVDTQPEVQALANAAAHVMTAAGLPSGTSNPLTGAELTALGVTGLTANNTQAVINAIVGQTSDANVDTLAELQAIADAAQTKANTALTKIQAAADNNNAAATVVAQDYLDAGVAGVTNATITGAVNSALDSAAVTRNQVDTVAHAQAIVDAYAAILATADGVGNTATPLLTGAQYAALGVTGLSASAVPVAGSALSLLDDAVDRSATSAVDTVRELQNLLGAANAVQSQAAGTAGLTMAQLGLLGVTDASGVLLANTQDAVIQQAILAKIAAAADNGTGTDTVAEIQALVDASFALRTIKTVEVGNPGSTDDTVTEGAPLVYNVTLTNASTTATEFTYNLGGGTASPTDYGTASFSNGVTYNAATGKITVPAAVTSFTVTLPTVNDTLFEATETVPLVIGGITGSGSILDNEVAPAVMSVNAYQNGSENGGKVAWHLKFDTS